MPQKARIAWLRMTTALMALLLASSLLLWAAMPPWQPAYYHGLLVGRATRAEVLRALGAADSESTTGKAAELHYHGRGEHKGELIVRLGRNGRLSDVEEDFPVAIPRTIIYKELGKDAMTSHFSEAACAGRTLYRDPRGPIELTLYPALGIMLWPDQYGYDFAAIHYLPQPPGAPRPACVAREPGH
jgi:hypothetical protein